MADDIVTREQLENASKDASSLELFISGNVDEDVLTRLGQQYPTLAKLVRILMETGGWKAYTTEAALLATTPTVNPSVGYAFDTKKLYLWNGTTWTSEGVSPWEQAKTYTDQQDLIFDNLAKLFTNAKVDLSQTISQYLVSKSPDVTAPKFGSVTPATPYSNVAPGTYILIPQASVATTIKRFSVISNITSGDIELRTYTGSGTTFTMQKSIGTLHVSKVGLNEFGVNDFLPFTVNAGEYVAAVVKTGGAMVYSGSSTTDQYYSSTNLGTGPITGTAGKLNLKAAFFDTNGAERAKVFIDFLEQVSNESDVNFDNILSSYTGNKGLVATPSAKSGVNNGAGHMCIGAPISGFGTVSLLEVYSASSGLAQVGVYTRSGTAFTRKRHVDVNLVAGLNTIPVNLAIGNGEYVGLRTTVVGQVEYESNSAGHEGMFVSTGASTDDSFNVSSTTPIGQFAYQLRFGLTYKSIKPDVIGKPWAGREWVPFGDSITWYFNRIFAETHIERGQVAIGYQAAVRDAMGCTIINKGESGWTMPRIYNERISTYDFSNTYITTITSGANDQRTEVSVGTIAAIGSTFDTTEYAGAMQAAIEHVIASNPLCKIVLITPIRGWFNVINDPPDVPTTDPTALGVIKREYPDMVKAIGKLYGLPVVDFYDDCGLNDLNKNIYLGDDPAVFDKYLLHPTNAFFKRMGEILLATLKNL